MAATEAAALLTDRHRRQLDLLRDSTARLVVARWASIDVDDFAAWFAGWARQAAATVERAQIQAASLADRYLSTYLLASRVRPRSRPVDPGDFAGADMDGRPLARSFDTARIATLYLLGRGQGRERALAYGLDSALRISRSAVMTAARQAQTQRMQTEPAVAGWVRVTSSSPCGACLALAGLRQSTGHAFDAHDRCACHAEPVLDGARDKVTRPTGAQLLEHMDPAARARYGQIDPDDLGQLIARSNGRIYQAAR